MLRKARTNHKYHNQRTVREAFNKERVTFVRPQNTFSRFFFKQKKNFSCEGAALEVLMSVYPCVCVCAIWNLRLYEGSWRFLKIPEGSWRFLKIHEGSGSFRKFLSRLSSSQELCSAWSYDFDFIAFWSTFLEEKWIWWIERIHLFH